MRDVDKQKTSGIRIIYRWGPALVMMGVIFTISSFPSTSIPNYGTFDFWVKKSGHLLGYIALAIAYNHALAVNGPGRGSVAWLLAVLFAISDEFHQSFVPGRTAWVVDILIDASGALIGTLVYLLTQSQKSESFSRK